MFAEIQDRLCWCLQVRFFDMFTDGALRWPLFIAVMMMMSQQFSGINVVRKGKPKHFVDFARGYLSLFGGVTVLKPREGF